jgi:hypothetical protein
MFTEDWAYCIIDASKSTDEEFCFVEVSMEEGDFSVKHNSELVSDEAPAEVVGVMHPEGEDKADEWAQQNLFRIKELMMHFAQHNQEKCKPITYH